MRALKTILVALALTLPCAVVIAQSRPAPNLAFRIIVHPGNSTTSVDRKFLADVFLKRITRWNEGESIRPADLDSESTVRRRFSEDVLKRSVGAVKSYWQQLVFSGRGVPPPEFDTDEDVVKYVLRYPGAIGYVSGTANVDRVRVLIVK